MFWGAFGAGRTIALDKIEGTLNSQGYTKIIENCLVPVWKAEWKLLQDNAPIHTSQRSMAFFESFPFELI